MTGGIAAGVNIAARRLLEFIASYTVAIILAYLCGMATAFVLARVFVFDGAGGGVHGQFLRFALVNAVALAQVLLVSLGLARLIFPALGFVWQAETVAHVIGVISPVATSYVLHKRFSFRKSVAAP